VVIAVGAELCGPGAVVNGGRSKNIPWNNWAERAFVVIEEHHAAVAASAATLVDDLFSGQSGQPDQSIQKDGVSGYRLKNPGKLIWVDADDVSAASLGDF
jgi:hypothetical protein